MSQLPMDEYVGREAPSLSTGYAFSEVDSKSSRVASVRISRTFKVDKPIQS